MITFGKKLKKGVAPQAAVPVAAPLQAVAPPSVSGQDEAVWRVLPLEGSFQFSYLDASGRPSLRRLSASELKVGPGKLLLGGVDADLQAYRGFRVDRMYNLHQAGSDEIISRNILDWLLDRAAKQAREKAALAKAQRIANATNGKRRSGEDAALAAA